MARRAVGPPASASPSGLQRAISQVTLRARTLTSDAPAPSPCISICRMSASGATNGLCEGCFRTRDEIAGWSGASEEGRRSVWKSIEQRMAALASS